MVIYLGISTEWDFRYFIFLEVQSGRRHVK